MSDDVPKLRDALKLQKEEGGRLKGLSARQFGHLILRTWPYLFPQWPHLVLLVAMRMLIELVWTGAILVSYDVWSNKVLVGDMLEPMQASYLFLDESYVLPPDELALKRSAEESGEEELAAFEFSKLSDAQRKVVRNRFLMLCVFAGSIVFLLWPIVDYYKTWILQRVNQSLRITMVERAEHLSLRYHDTARTGDLIYRVYQDSAMITNLMDYLVLQPAIAIFTLTFSLFVIVSFSLTLGLMGAIGLIPMLWLVAWYTPRLQLRSRLARLTNSALTSRIQEGFQAIRVIKANLALGVMDRRFNKDSYEALNAAFMLRAELLLMRTVMALIFGAMIVVTQYLSARWVIGNEATFLFGVIAFVGFARWNWGAWQAANGRMSEYVWNVNDLIRVWSVLQDMIVGLDRAFFLLDLKPDIEDKPGAKPVGRPIFDIEFNNVSFSYDKENRVLEDIDLKVPTGTLTAIVGGTGSGKSTMMSLLLRLYDPDQGAIRIDGVDLQDLKVESVRSSIAIALQQNTLFASTIAENIAYGAANVTQDQIEEAAKIACAHEFIEQMERGYETELGERGSKLSTGQRQRLSIARALVRDTPILILDEPTSALDALTEHRIMENLLQWGRDRIVFLITHRFSTIQQANRIILLDERTIVSDGSHEELMSKADTRYRAFFASEIRESQRRA